MSKPPKIGLVLSGGAARGLAHIGVLKALAYLDFIGGKKLYRRDIKPPRLYYQSCKKRFGYLNS